MTSYAHLDPAHQALADLPDEERIEWIRAERWIAHPAAEMALAAMEDLLVYPQRNRMPCLLVHGRTGMGKTMILRKFSRDHPRTVDPRLGLARSPVVMMQLPPKPAEVPFYEELLGALGLPLVGDVSRIRARRMARDALRIIGARILVIDEIHALLVGGDRQQRVFLNVIRLLASFAAVLPLRQPSELDDERVRTAILKLSEGVTVRIVRLLERLAVEAIGDRTERITLGNFDALPARAPLLSMEGRRRAEALG